MSANTLPQGPPQPGFLIHDIVRLFRQCFGGRIADLSLSEAQWRALGSVNKLPGISQTQLAELLGIGKAPLGQLIDRLEHQQLLCRSPSPQDRRTKQLSVTAIGAAKAEIMRERYETLEAEFLSGISHKHRQDIERLLLQVYRNLSDHPAAQLSLMHRLTVISRLSSRHFDPQLKSLGFTHSQWRALAAVVRSPTIRQSDLAQQLSLRKAPLGAVIDSLEDSGWITRGVDPEDRRARRINPTDRCINQWQSLSQTYQALYARSMQGISEQDRLELRDHLISVHARLQALSQGQREQRSTPA